MFASGLSGREAATVDSEWELFERPLLDSYLRIIVWKNFGMIGRQLQMMPRATSAIADIAVGTRYQVLSCAWMSWTVDRTHIAVTVQALSESVREGGTYKPPSPGTAETPILRFSAILKRQVEY
jgi:hypothetical protein